MPASSAQSEIERDPDKPFDGFWDLEWLHFTFAALTLAIALRAVARKAFADERLESRTPEEVLTSGLAELVTLRVRFKLHPREFARGIKYLEEFLRHHLEADYETPWAALLAGCEDLIQQLSQTIRDAVLDFEIFRDQLEEEGATDPETLRTLEGLRGARDRMRLLLLEAEQPGEVGAA